MGEYVIGVYWKNRTSTLRQHASESIGLFRLLQDLHPKAFEEFSWVGDRPGAAVKFEPDLSNADDLIYLHAGSKTSTYDITRADGGPAWEALSDGGYMMFYNTGRSSSAGGISLSVITGQLGNHLPNSCVLSFPDEVSAKFPYQEFRDYGFLKSLFLALIEYWRPQSGLVTSVAFSRIVVSEGSPKVGWLTYVKDPRAQAIRNDDAFNTILIEHAPHGGTLFSLGTAPISPSDAGKVIQARRLREKLLSEGLFGP